MNIIFGSNLILFVTGLWPSGTLADIIINRHSHSLFTRIFFQPPGRGVAFVEFLTTYVASIISAALGLAKCLKNGVVRPIAPGGTLDGLLTGQFLVALLASAGSLVTKGLCIAFTTVSHISYILYLINYQ